MMNMYPQYIDLPQIPSMAEDSFPDDSQVGAWPNFSMHMYHQHASRSETDFNYSDGMVRMQNMERFLLDTSPLTAGLLHAKLDGGMPLPSQHLGRYEQQLPAPELLRYDSPDRTSVSGASSYATQNELRSPLPYHTVSYGSPEDSSQSNLPYPTTDQLNEIYPPELPLPGGSISLREIEYEHQEPELSVEETDNVDMKTETAYEEPPFMKTETASDNYEVFHDSDARNSLRDAESVQPMEPSGEDSSDQEYTPKKSSRRRRSSASNSSSGRQSQRRRSQGRKNSATFMPSHANRVTKRSGRVNASSGAIKPSNESNTDGEAQRSFPCPLAGYGCQSKFSSKNEWKRHVSTQHIKLGFWRCDLCAETVDPHDEQTIYHNDFNRKDLYTQHLRRMHAAPANSSARNQKEYPVNEDNIADHQKRCYRKLRDAPPQSHCLFCEETFHGPNSWDNRMEHIGRHLEKDRKAGLKLLDIPNWHIDKGLEQWLLDEGLIAYDRNGYWKISDGRPRRRSITGDAEDSENDA